MRGIHRFPVNSPQKGQGRGALTFSLICAWTNGWANNRDAGDLSRLCAHHDVTVMIGWRKTNRSISQIPQCTRTIFRSEICPFLFRMVHCGISDRCIVGLRDRSFRVLGRNISSTSQSISSGCHVCFPVDSLVNLPMLYICETKNLMIYSVISMHKAMMTLSNGIIFCVTGLLCDESTSHRWIPLTNAGSRSFDAFFDLPLNQQLSKQWERRWFETPPCS